MLYVSTRNKTDSFTAYRTLHEDRTPDGGFFVPLRLPYFEKEQVDALRQKNFGQIVADVLNLFFSTDLTGWDIDFCIGRHPFHLVTMSHRLVIAELWHNHGGAYSYTQQNIYNKLCDSSVTGKPTEWAKIAIRIAILFGLYAELSSGGIEEIDVAVASGDFSVPMAIWYARQMGLHFGMIICGCNENGAAWDLIHRGEFNTNSRTIHTDIPELDIAHPDSLERLIFATLGRTETLRYLDVKNRGGVYQLDEETLAALNADIFAAVVSSKRAHTVVNNLLRTNDYTLNRTAAVAYGSLQDYRARTGGSRPTLLLSDETSKE